MPARHVPLALLGSGLAASLAGATLVLHYVFRRMPSMEDGDTKGAALQLLLPHILLLIGLLLASAGGVYIIRQRVIARRENES